MNDFQLAREIIKNSKNKKALSVKANINEVTIYNLVNQTKTEISSYGTIKKILTAINSVGFTDKAPSIIELVNLPNVSLTQISIDTNIPISTLSWIKRGRRHPDAVQWRTIEVLYDYYQKCQSGFDKKKTWTFYQLYKQGNHFYRSAEPLELQNKKLVAFGKRNIKDFYLLDKDASENPKDYGHRINISVDVITNFAEFVTASGDFTQNRDAGQYLSTIMTTHDLPIYKAVLA